MEEVDEQMIGPVALGFILLQRSLQAHDKHRVSVCAL